MLGSQPTMPMNEAVKIPGNMDFFRIDGHTGLPKLTLHFRFAKETENARPGAHSAVWAPFRARCLGYYVPMWCCRQAWFIVLPLCNDPNGHGQVAVNTFMYNCSANMRILSRFQSPVQSHEFAYQLPSQISNETPILSNFQSLAKRPRGTPGTPKTFVTEWSGIEEHLLKRSCFKKHISTAFVKAFKAHFGRSVLWQAF